MERAMEHLIGGNTRFETAVEPWLRHILAQTLAGFQTDMPINSATIDALAAYFVDDFVRQLDSDSIDDIVIELVPGREGDFVRRFFRARLQ